jgi:hypothetical protein
MSICIVESKEIARIYWFQVSIGTEGEIFINLGIDPSVGEISEIEKIAVRHEQAENSYMYIMNDKDYMISFFKLAQKTFLNLYVLESDIGRIIAHKLETMQIASHYYGR